MRALIIIWVFCLPAFVFGQAINPDGFNVFYHINGNKSAEGFLREGKPDGYWKNYFENGNLMSEGNRKDFLLDSVWVFYNEDGSFFKKITYKEGQRNGPQISFFKDYYLEEVFEEDLRTGFLKKYYLSGEIKESIPLVNGREHGIGKEYSREGLVTGLNDYRNGILVSREIINRFDRNGNRQGKWKFFYDDGNLQLEGFYRNDLRHGFFKQYSREGVLLSVLKFEEGKLVADAPELVTLDLRYDYYPSGKVKSVGSYKGSNKEGLHREYKEDGSLIKASLFENNIKTGEGLLNNEGLRNGEWKDFYSNGALKSKGQYLNGKKVGLWKHYYPNGTLEQKGNYNTEGLADGEWLWFYESSDTLKIVNYRRGLEEGMMMEYSRGGNLIAKGEYIEGKREYDWFYSIGEVSIYGSYRYGEEDGFWKHFRNGTLIFEGNFVDGFSNGIHKWYFDNGKLREIGNYRMGQKQGEWKKFLESGVLFITVEFMADEEIKVDGEELFKKGY